MSLPELHSKSELLDDCSASSNFFFLGPVLEAARFRLRAGGAALLLPARFPILLTRVGPASQPASGPVTRSNPKRSGLM